VITTAAKRDLADPKDVVEAVGWMTRLNRAAAETAVVVGAAGATDITGFGFLGHASELAESSGVTLRVRLAQVPILEGARRYAAEWLFPGGSAANQMAFGAGVRCAEGISAEEQMLLFDAQTSGGLLVCVPADQAEAFAARLKAAGQPCWRVGEVIPREADGTNILVEA
jgi:selenide,water dikinase